MLSLRLADRRASRLGCTMVAVLRVVRHRLGPRVYVFRRRIHEWHVGIAVLVGVAAATITGRLGPTSALLLALTGVWLIVKDWNDLTRPRGDLGSTGVRCASGRSVTSTACPRRPRSASRSSRSSISPRR